MGNKGFISSNDVLLARSPELATEPLTTDIALDPLNIDSPATNPEVEAPSPEAFSTAIAPDRNSSQNGSNNGKSFHPDQLRQALGERLKSLTLAEGIYQLPCLPSMLPEYMKLVRNLLKLMGQNSTPEEINALEKLIAGKLAEGFRVSPNARLVLNYKPANPQAGLSGGVTFQTQLHIETLADKYKLWPQTKKEPLFGSYPDAKVMAVAKDLGDPKDVPVLDVGAGVGRNTLPLAQLGHPVDAIELTPAFAETLEAAARTQSLPVKVTTGDVLDPLLRIGVRRYRLAISAEVISHFRHTEQVRLFLAKMCDALWSGGLLLFSSFIAVDGYEPDATFREFAEAFWCFTMTREELTAAMEGLPLEVLSEEPVIEYEKAHLPPESWPPTDWFVNWATGRNVFPIESDPPLELRWFLMKRI